MPFDGKEAQFETPAIRRHIVSRELKQGRFPWWNFSDPRHCAIPVAKRLCGGYWPTQLGLTIRQTIKIFGIFAALVGYSRFYHCWVSRVTPAMVADALEKIG